MQVLEFYICPMRCGLFWLRKLKPKEIKVHLQGQQQDRGRDKSGGSRMLLLCWAMSLGGYNFRRQGALTCP